MIPVSERFLAAILQGHEPAVSVTINGEEIPLRDGSVTLDGEGTTRASISLTLAVGDFDLPDWVPDRPEDILAPYGNGDIVASRGIRYPDGTPDMVPLGKFRIDETTASESESGEVTVTVTGYDFSSYLIDAVFEDERTFAGGEDAAELIRTLIDDSGFQDRVTYRDDFFDVPVELPQLYYGMGEDRWDFCQGLAEAVNGGLLYFDRDAVLVLDRRSPGLAPVYTITEGSNLISLEKRWPRENACNRVVVLGENDGADPVIGERVDDEPGSPTNYTERGATFGRVTFTYSSEYITDSDQADAVAARILSQRVGSVQQIELEALVNPALDPGDVVRVVRERLGVEELHTIDSLTIPLTTESGTMSISTREMRVFG